MLGLPPLYATWTEVLASTITLNLDLEVGTTVAGAPVTVSGAGLRAGSAHSLVVRSTPQTIASGTASSTGTFTARGVMPTGLAAGQHTVTLSAIAADGSAISRVAYLTVNNAGTVTYLSYSAAEATTPAALAATGTDIGPSGITATLLLFAGGALLLVLCTACGTPSRRRKTLAGVS